jgi:hypothetical protein
LRPVAAAKPRTSGTWQKARCDRSWNESCWLVGNWLPLRGLAFCAGWHGWCAGLVVRDTVGPSIDSGPAGNDIHAGPGPESNDPTEAGAGCRGSDGCNAAERRPADRRDRAGRNKEVEVAILKRIWCYLPVDLRKFRVTPEERKAILTDLVKMGVLQTSVLKQIDMQAGALKGKVVR